MKDTHLCPVLGSPTGLVTRKEIERPENWQQ
jgi:hypothetical protein